MNRKQMIVLFVCACMLTGCAKPTPARTKIIPGTAEVHSERFEQKPRQTKTKYEFESPKPVVKAPETLHMLIIISPKETASDPKK